MISFDLTESEKTDRTDRTGIGAADPVELTPKLNVIHPGVI